MCIAIYKPQGIKTPSLDILEQCWYKNPDGAGFALANTDQSKNYSYIIHKGYMTFKDFEKAYRSYDLEHEQGEIFFHFRIATHGGVKAGNCHPFPITADKKILQAKHVLSNSVLMHNGVLPITPSDKAISDTMELCKRLSTLGTNYIKAMTFLDEFIGSNKIAVMHKGETKLFGAWQELDGVFYSNMLWEKINYFDYYDYYDEPMEIEANETEELLLMDNLCPDCGFELVNDLETRYCERCNIIWTKREQTKKNRPKKKSSKLSPQ